MKEVDPAILAEINHIRTIQFKPNLAAVPPGRKRTACCCPLARALDAHVSSDMFVGKDGVGHPLPLILSQFVVDVDRGAYPQLQEGPSSLKFQVDVANPELIPLNELDFAGLIVSSIAHAHPSLSVEVIP